jgi:hypothetical protein
MTLRWRRRILLTALLAVSAWTYASTEHRRPSRTREARRPTSRMSSPGPKLLSGDEFMVDTTIAYGPTPGRNPAVAYGSSEYLVVWQNQNSNVYAARVDASGSVLDPWGIGIAPAGTGSGPAVAFDGEDFMVVWCAGDEIYGARVAPSGLVLDPGGTPIGWLSVCRAPPAVASGDTSCLVVWAQERDSASTDIYGARVTRSGIVLDPGGVPIARDSDEQDEPGVAYDGTDFLVVWQHASPDSASNICGVRVNSAGVVLDTTAIPISSTPNALANPAVSFGDSVFLVAWQDSGSVSNRGIFCARVSPAGEVLDTNGIRVCAIDSAQANPAVVFDGTCFTLTWTDSRHGWNSDIYGARVTQTGIMLDTLGFPVCTVSGVQQLSAVAPGDTLCLAVWQDNRYGFVWGPDIYAARISRSGSTHDSLGLLVSLGLMSWQSAPRVAATDSGYLVAWEQRDLPEHVHYTRLRFNGDLADSAPGVAPNYPRASYSPAIAVADTDALIAWVSYGVMAARVTCSGMLRDTSGIRVVSDTVSFSSPSVASDGSNWLVAWQQGSNGDIRAARVSAAGALLDSTAINVSADTLGQTSPRIAFGDSLYVALWVTGHPGGRSDICAARLTRSGRVLDTACGRVSFDSGYAESPDLAFSGSGFLAVWENVGAHREICGARLNPDGVVIDSEPILISSEDFDCQAPSVAFDGTDYLVAWQDNRQDPGSGIYAARVTRMGTVFQEFPVTPHMGEGEPCLASAPGGRVMVVYQAQADSVNGRPFGWARIWGRLSPFEGIQENPTQVAPRLTLNVIPNPLNNRAEMRYALPVNSHVRLAVYDISGRLVQMLADDEQKAGSYALRWNGTARNGRLLANGVYILRLDANGRSETRTLTIAR